MHKIHQKQVATKIVLERTARTAATLPTAAMLLIAAILPTVVILLIAAMLLTAVMLLTAQNNLNRNKVYDRVCYII